MLESIGQSRGTFHSLDPYLKVTFSLENWRNSGGGQKSPSISQLEFQSWCTFKEKAAGNQKSEVTMPKKSQSIWPGPKTPISEH